MAFLEIVDKANKSVVYSHFLKIGSLNSSGALKKHVGNKSIYMTHRLTLVHGIKYILEVGIELTSSAIGHGGAIADLDLSGPRGGLIYWVYET